jgi:hypothetical protein
MVEDQDPPTPEPDLLPVVEEEAPGDQDWLQGDDEDDEDVVGQIDEYDLASSPNDFNVLTIYSFIESGAVKIPGFQRNYVWDIKRASKLIESLIIGLPVPQIFLYEKARNQFLVIDGQQRLMTIYYFIRGRFPRREKRSAIRRVFDSQGKIPDDILFDDDLFDDFRLRLPDVQQGTRNKFNGKTYKALGDYKTQFDLRTIRNVIVKQVRPRGGDSSIYEMFNRLNTGGINLTPQEIRASLYHSDFYDMLFKVNMDARWRRLLDQPEADLHMRDVQVLLRGIALWRRGEYVASSMASFLNEFSKDAQEYPESEILSVESDITWFLDATSDVAPEAFQTRQGRFSLPLFDAIFPAALAMRAKRDDFRLTSEQIQNVASSDMFLTHAQKQTTNARNVNGRLNAGKLVIGHPAGGNE